MSIIVDKYLDCIYYLTIDNIFCVYINESNNDVHIYEYKDEDESKDEDEDADDGYNGLNNYSVLIATYNPVKIFIGKSPLNQQTIFSGGHGPYFDGNTILLKLDTNKQLNILIFNAIDFPLLPFMGSNWQNKVQLTENQSNSGGH